MSFGSNSVCAPRLEVLIFLTICVLVFSSAGRRFAGLKAEAINRLCAASVECQRLAQKHETAKPLAIPETVVLWQARAIQSAIEWYKNPVANDLGPHRIDLKEMAIGILPSLRYIAERDALDKREICATDFLQIAVPDDRNLQGRVDPYGVDGFRCSVCWMELAHAYFHCDGCEYSGKDYNVCTDCYIERQYLGRPHYDTCAGGPGVVVPHGKCGCRELTCDHDGCKKLKPCSCRCHEFFHRRTRFFTDEEIRELVAAAESLAEGKEVKYHQETLVRLQGKVMVKPGTADDYVAKIKAARQAATAKRARPIQDEMEVEPTGSDAQADDAKEPSFQYPSWTASIEQRAESPTEPNSKRTAAEAVEKHATKQGGSVVEIVDSAMDVDEPPDETSPTLPEESKTVSDGDSADPEEFTYVI